MPVRPIPKVETSASCGCCHYLKGTGIRLEALEFLGLELKLVRSSKYGIERPGLEKLLEESVVRELSE
jgi:hypothetical protein